MLKNLIAAAAVALATVTGAFASTFPSFQFDAANSSITLTETGSLCLGSCALTAGFNSDAQNLGPWTPTGPTDELRVNKFIDWNIGSGLGGRTYDVVVKLAFSAPDAALGSATGGALAGTLFGAISGGILSWDGPGQIAFAQGSVLDFYLDGTTKLGLGSSTTTGVTFKGNEIAPVPLPASALLLLSGIAGIGFMRRRKMAA